MRTLKLVVFSVIFFLSSNLAHSLGVGDITVKSTLNEPLNAEIALVSLRPGEIDNIRVSMATPAEFARAGIERPYILTSLKFRVEERPGNRAAIIVYSKNPIKEPFLDFLVEIDWRSGRMLREYTMLLDPPTFAQQKAERVQIPVAPAPVKAPQDSKPEPMPAPVVVSQTPAKTTAPVSVEPDQPADELFPRIDIGGTDTKPATEEPFRPVLDVSSEGYKTKRKDTLWSISDRLRPEGISIEQMMLALQNANPDAFEDNNINGLKAGYVLRIPDQKALLAFSKSEAFRETQNQHKAWHSARGGLIERETTKGTAPVTEETAKPEPKPGSEAGVKLVTPQDGVASEGSGTGKDLEALRQELALVNEQLASKEQHNTELQARVVELEEQIATMERLIELKNKSLEDLQDKVSEQEQVVAEAPKPAEPQVEAKPEAEAKPEEPAAPAKPVKPAGEPEVINRYALDDVDKVEVPTEAKPKAAKKPAPVAQQPKEESIVDVILGLLGNVTILALLGAVLIGIIALVWIVMHRRRMSNMSFPESILTDKGATTTTEEKPAEETSLLSDFAPTSMGTGSVESDEGEVDPLSEADVYIAYNKYQQAEELLQKAISSEPGRTDLKVKLLEVYYNAKNADAFGNLAEEVHSAVGGQDDALWDKVDSMGKDLCPDHALFGGGQEEGGLDIAEISEDDMSAADTTEDLEFDLSDLEIDEEPEAEEEPEEISPAVEEEPAAEIDDMSLDFDTKDLDAAISMTEQAEEKDEFADLDLEPMAEETAEEPAADLGELDLEAFEAEIEEPAVEEPAAEADDEFVIDEVATKLDLAKAYIDMGDPDGARGILDEVMAEGNDAQKSEAQELIQQL